MSLSSLPLDVQTTLLEFLPLPSQLALQRTSKEWGAAVDSYRDLSQEHNLLVSPLVRLLEMPQSLLSLFSARARQFASSTFLARTNATPSFVVQLVSSLNEHPFLRRLWLRKKIGVRERLAAVKNLRTSGSLVVLTLLVDALRRWRPSLFWLPPLSLSLRSLRLRQLWPLLKFNLLAAALDSALSFAQFALLHTDAKQTAPTDLAAARVRPAEMGASAAEPPLPPPRSRSEVMLAVEEAADDGSAWQDQALDLELDAFLTARRRPLPPPLVARRRVGTDAGGAAAAGISSPAAGSGKPASRARGSGEGKTMELLRRWLPHALTHHGSGDLLVKLLNDCAGALNGALRHRFLQLALVMLVAHLWRSFFRVFFFLDGLRLVVRAALRLAPVVGFIAQMIRGPDRMDA